MKLKTILITALIVTVLTVPVDAGRTRQQIAKDDAHQVAELMRSKGYGEDNPIIQAAQQFWQEQHRMEQIAPEFVQSDRYPHAALVWNLLREAGFSEAVTAGILGNMMAECGGQTLDLQPYIYAGNFYGLCMWSLYYTPQVDGLDIHGQVEVLLDTLETNLWQAGGSIEVFKEITDAGEAARYFDRYYERSDGKSVWQRMENAKVALEYFTN